MYILNTMIVSITPHPSVFAVYILRFMLCFFNVQHVLIVQLSNIDRGLKVERHWRGKITHYKFTCFQMCRRKTCALSTKVFQREREREYDSPGVLISDKKIQKPTNVYWSARLHIKHVVYLKSVDKSYPTSATYISFIHCLVKVKQNHVSR